QHRARVVRGEDDAGGFDGDIGAGTDRHPDIGAGQRGSVVDTVAHHRDLVPAVVQFGDLCVLVFGQHFGENLVDTEVGGDGVGDLTRIAGDHRDLHAAGVQRVDGSAGFFADGVFEGDGAEHAVTVDDMQHRGSALYPAAGDGGDVFGYRQPG